MPLVLWSLALTMGILMLLARLPLHAPAFEQLTQYDCDRLPNLPMLGNRYQACPLTLRCRARDQVVFQRQSVIDGSNPRASKACKQQSGLVRIWRMAPPSAYGSYVFHTTCDDHVLMYFKNRAARYESAQQFVILIACAIIILSTIGLIRRITRLSRTQLHKTPRDQR
jgi:hypothetical protein